MVDSNNPWNLHSCDQCSYRSQSNFLMNKHLTRHETELNVDSSRCSFYHGRDLYTLEQYECEYCEFATDIKVGLDNHVKTFHKEKVVRGFKHLLGVYKCGLCNFQSYSLLVLTKHANSCHVVISDSLGYRRTIVNGVEWFVCEHCYSKFKTKVHLNRHILSKHGGLRTLQCEQCSYCFKSETDLKGHIAALHSQLHKPQNRLKCYQCTYTTKSEDHLKKHILIHGLQCTVKDARFSEYETKQPSRKRAVKWHQCELCLYKARSKMYLKRHTEQHSKGNCVNRLQCKHCVFKCLNIPTLSLHNLIKHGDAANKTGFKCEHCTYIFGAKDDLIRHLLTKHKFKVKILNMQVKKASV